MGRTAVIVAVPEAAPLVDRWRLRFTPDAPLGVPPHVTVLFPFLTADAVDDAVGANLRRLFGALSSFRFSLARVARFPELAYLAPEPAEPFVAMTRALVERYPECPPYEGEFGLDEIVPHLTVAHGDPALQDAVEAALTPSLPIEVRVDEVLLIEEQDDGAWLGRHRFRLCMA